MDLASTTFLFGSGISIPSGLPSVTEITAKLIDDLYKPPTEIHPKFSSTNPDGWDSNAFISEATKCFLLLLKSHCDEHLALHASHPCTYEDIYYIAKQIGDFLNGNYDNPALLGFLSDLRSKSELLISSLETKYELNGLAGPHRKISLQSLADKSLKRIELIVERELRLKDKIVGLNLLSDIIKYHDKTPLKIISLNHDLLLEKHFESKEICDGFADETKDFNLFSPSNFDKKENAEIILLKPHGSIDWFTYKGIDNESIFYARCHDLSKTSDLKTKSGDKVDQPIGRLSLTGTTNKELYYGSGIFLELLYQMHDLLRQTKTLVISGYGFRDKGINNRIIEWKNNSQDNRIIILHRSKESLIQNARPAAANLLNNSKNMVFINKWLCETEASELLKT